MATNGSNELNAILKAKVVKILVELDYKNSNLGTQVNDISKWLRDNNKKVELRVTLSDTGLATEISNLSKKLSENGKKIKLGVALDLTITNLNSQLSELYKKIDESKIGAKPLKLDVAIDVQGSASKIKEELKQVYDIVTKFNQDYGKQLKDIQKLTESTASNIGNKSSRQSPTPSTTPLNTVDPSLYIQQIKDAEDKLRSEFGKTGNELFGTTQLKDAEGNLKGFVASLTNANGVIQKIKYQWNDEAKAFSPINQTTIDETQKMVDKAKRSLQGLYDDVQKLNDGVAKDNLWSKLQQLESNGSSLNGSLNVNDVNELQQQIKEEQALQQQVNQVNNGYVKQEELVRKISQAVQDYRRVADLTDTTQYNNLKSYRDLLKSVQGVKINSPEDANFTQQEQQLKDINNTIKQQQADQNAVIKNEKTRLSYLQQIDRLSRQTISTDKDSNQLIAEARALADTAKSGEEWLTIQKKLSSVKYNLADTSELRQVIGLQDKITQQLMQMKNYGKLTEDQFARSMAQLDLTATRGASDLQRMLSNVARQAEQAKIAAKDIAPLVSGGSSRASSLQSMVSTQDVESLKKYFEALYQGGVQTVTFKDREDALGRSVTEFKVKMDGAGKSVQSYVLQMENANGALRQVSSGMEYNANRNLGVMEQLGVAMARVPVWMMAMTAFYGTIHLVESMTQQFIQLSNAMNDIQRVASSNINLDTLFGNAVDLSQQLGANLQDVVVAIGDMAKTFGDFNERQLTAITQTAILMSNVSDLSVAQAGTDLVSTMNAFNISASDSIHIVDALNQVDNDFAISTTQLASGLTKSASVASTFGVTLEQLVGNITAIGSVTMESGDVIGNSLKTIYSRIGTLGKAQQALQQFGVAVKTAGGQTRDVESILGDLGARWHELTDTQKQYIAINVAGQYQLTRFLALMNNWDTSTKATNEAINSQGSALRENQIYMQSFTARFNQLKSSFTEFSNAVGKEILSAGVMTAISALEGLLSVGIKIAGTFGTLPTVLIPVVALLGKFGVLGKVSGFFGGLATQIRAFTVAGVESETMLKTLWSNYRIGTSMGNTQLGSIRNAWRALTVATMGATEETIAWKTAMKSAFIESVVGVAIIALGFAIEKVANAVEKARQKQQDLNATNDKMVTAYRKSSDGMQSMVQRYTELSNIQIKTTAQQQEYNQLQHDFATQIPTTVAYVDANGQAHMKSAQAIAQEVQNVKELSQAQSALKVVEFDQNIQKQADSYQKVVDNIKNLNKQAEQLKQDNGKTITISNGDGSYQTITENYTKAIQENKIASIEAEADKTKALQGTIKVIQQQALAYLDANNQLTNLGDKEQSVVETFVSQNEDILRASNDSIDAQKALYTIGTQVGQVFSDAMVQYGKSIKDLPVSEQTQKMKDFQQEMDNLSVSLPDYFLKMTDGNGNVVKSQEDVVNGLKEVINVTHEVGSASQSEIPNLIYQLERSGMTANDAQAYLYKLADAQNNVDIKSKLASQGIDGETASLQDLNQETAKAIDLGQELFGYTNDDLEAMRTRLQAMQAMTDEQGKQAEQTQKYKDLANEVASQLGITTAELEQHKEKYFAVIQAMEIIGNDFDKYTPAMTWDQFVTKELKGKFTQKTIDIIKGSLTSDAFTGVKTDFNNQLKDALNPTSKTAKAVQQQIQDIFPNVKLKLPPVDWSSVQGSIYYTKNDLSDLEKQVKNFGITIGKPTKDATINQMMGQLDVSKGKLVDNQKNLLILRGILSKAIAEPNVFTHAQSDAKKSKDATDKAKKSATDFADAMKKSMPKKPSDPLQISGGLDIYKAKTQQVKDGIAGVGQALTKNPLGAGEDFVSKLMSNAENQTNKTKDAVKSTVKASAGLDGTTKTLQNIQVQIKSTNTQVSNIGKNFNASNLVKQLGKIDDALNTIKSNSKNVAGAIAGIAVVNMNFGIGNMVKQIEDFAKALRTAGDNAKYLTSELNNVKDAMSKVVSYAKKFTDDIAGVGGNGAVFFQDMAKAIEGAVSKMKKAYNENASALNIMVKNDDQSMNQMIKNITDNADKASKATTEMADKMKSAFTKGMKEIVSQASDLPSQIGKSITDNMNDSSNAIGKLADDMVNRFKKDLGIHSPSRVFTELGGWVVKGLSNGLSDHDLESLGQSVFKDFGNGIFTSMDSIKAYLGGDIGGTASPKAVQAWLSSAINQTGVPQSWLPALTTIAMHESGGNPTAVNNWDSNAKAGHPSTGLMQVIQPTFDAYAVKGHDNILNPIDNAMASIEYIKKRYGSIYNVPGVKSMMGGGGYKGYATGGIVNTPELAWHGEDGAEAIIPLTDKYRQRGVKLWEQAGQRLGIDPKLMDVLKQYLDKRNAQRSGQASGGSASAGASSGEGGTSGGGDSGTSGTVIPSIYEAPPVIGGGYDIGGGYTFSALADQYSDYVIISQPTAPKSSSSNSGNTSKKSTSSSSTSKSSSTQQIADAFQFDQWDREAKALDSYIQILQTRLGELSQNSVKYRDTLKDILSYQNQHLSVEKKDLSTLEARQKAINSELAKLPALNKQTASQRDTYNSLMQEYDQNIGTIQGLQQNIESEMATIKQDSLQIWTDFVGQIVAQYDDAINALKQKVTNTDFAITVYQAQHPNDQKGLLNLQEQKATQLQGEQATAKNKVDDLQGRYNSAVKSYGATSDQAKAVADDLKQATQDYQDATSAVIQAETDIKNTRASIADDSIQKLKDYYGQEQQIADSAIDAEQKKLDDAHNAKMQMYQDEQDAINAIYQAKQDQLDQQNAEEDYAKQMSDYNKQQADLENKIAVASRDTSTEGKKNLADLQSQLTDLNGQISDAQTSHQRDQEKQALQQQQQDQINAITGYTDANGVKHDGLQGQETNSYNSATDALTAQKQATDDYYQNLINDDAKWAKVRSDAINGNFDEINKELKGMTDNLSNEMKGVFTGVYTGGAKVGTDSWSSVDNSQTKQTIKNEDTNVQQTKQNATDASNANSYTTTNGTVQTATATKVTDPVENTPPPKQSSSSSSSSSSSKSPSSSNSATQYYTIKKGDNFWDLEKKFGLSHGSLAKLNPSVNPNKLKIGQKIVIGHGNTNDDSFAYNNAHDPNRGKSGYVQAEDGSWVKSSFYNSGGSGYETTSALNLRSKASYSGSVEMVIPKGAKVDYEGMVNGWAKVKYDGKTGYVGKSYLKQFNTGGYTGDWVGDSGKLAVLHKKELVLNQNQTKDILDTAKLMSKLKGLIPQLSQSNLLGNLSSLGNNVTTNLTYGDINIVVQNADKKKATDVAKELMNEIRKRGK